MMIAMSLYLQQYRVAKGSIRIPSVVEGNWLINIIPLATITTAITTITVITVIIIMNITVSSIDLIANESIMLYVVHSFKYQEPHSPLQQVEQQGQTSKHLVEYQGQKKRDDSEYYHLIF